MTPRATRGDEDFQRVRAVPLADFTRAALTGAVNRTRALASEGAVAFIPSATRVFNGMLLHRRTTVASQPATLRQP